MHTNKLFISFSGGKTSAYMTYWILNNMVTEFEEIAVVFANTGKEREETLKFVNECDIHLGFKTIWVESIVHYDKRKGSTHKIVDYATASRNGEPFEAVIKKYGIPNQSFPHCTRELKTNPMHSYIKNALKWKGYKTAIGIRVDEIDRMDNNRKEKNYWYPLVENNINKAIIHHFWEQMPFTLQLEPHEGNCDFCWKKVISKLVKIENKNPIFSIWWEIMEAKYGNFIPNTRKGSNFKPPFFFGRQNKSIAEIREMTNKDPKPTEMDLFEFGCSETCEAF